MSLHEGPAPARPGPTGGLQVLGLCRFSYPALGGFQVEHESIEARRAMLYDPRRLEERFVWFEHLALAGVRRQTDPEFTLVVMLGEDFPQPWRARMEALAREVPQLRLDYRAPKRHVDVCDDVMRAHLDPAATHVAQFRLDDDDAMAVDFVAGLRAAHPRLRPLADAQGLVALDYCRGLVLWSEPQGIRVELRVAHCWAPALAIFLPAGHDKSLLHFPHHKVWQRMPTLSDPSRFMFLRGAHDTNDSRIATVAGAEAWSQERVEEVMQRRFGVDYRAFQMALAALRRG